MNYTTYNSEMYGRPALETSAAQAWPGLRVERYQMEAMELPAHYHEHHLLIIHQGATGVGSRRQNGSLVEEDQFRLGDAGLYPAGEYGPLAWDGPADVIHIHLDARSLEDKARRGLDAVRFALLDRFRFQDGMITQLGHHLLLAAGSKHNLGQLYVESLTNTLCYHLIEHHATYERHITRIGSRLHGSVLARIDAYLEAFSEASITLEALADLANLSTFHFARRFKLTTGLSPYQYVLDWKIQRARTLLRANEMPIAAVSDLLGFASPGHFSTAFKRAVGQTPREFQRS